MIEDLFYLGTFPFIATIVHHFFSNCLGCRLQKKSLILLIYFLYCLMSGGLYLSSFSGNIMGLLNIFLVLLLSFFYKSSLRWRIGAVMFIIAIIFLSDVMVQSLLMVIFPGYTTAIYILSLFISKFIMLTLAHVALRLFTSYGQGSLSGWYWCFLLFCPLMSFLGLYGLSRNYYIMQSPWLYSTLSIGLLSITFLVFILCDHVLRLQAIQRHAVLLKQQINYYTHQYLLAESAYKDTLRFRHDMKNILIGLKAKLKIGDVSGGQEILNTLIDDFNSSKGIAHSGNSIVDSLINYKQQTADLFKIVFHLDLRLPADIILDSTTISVILGNALDNAIEACQQVNNGNRYIKIQMHYQHESLFIHLENPYTGTIRTNPFGMICSTKSGYKAHGIGLKSINDMVEKLHGLLDIAYNNGIFQVDIVLFNVKRENEDGSFEKTNI